MWLAPLASETPEFLVAALLAWRGKATEALALLLAAKVNQWTLLVDSLALAYSAGAGHLASLPLDQRQVGEVFLTAAHSLYGLAVLARLRFGLRDAALMAGLFMAPARPGRCPACGCVHDAAAASAELFWFAGLYLVLAAWYFWRARHALAGFRHRRPRGDHDAA
jgi:cation:H+ antiporter